MRAGPASQRSATTALRSPIGCALLGLVIQHPGYGYELVQRFERTYGDVLALSSPSQVYSSLDVLKRRGLIEEVPPGEGGPGFERQPKPRYRATAKGAADYRQWLTLQLHEERRRARLLAVQLALLHPQEGLSVVDGYERACLIEAAAIPPSPVSARAADRRGDADAASALAKKLVQEEDRLALGAKLAFVEYARRELTEMAQRMRSER